MKNRNSDLFGNILILGGTFNPLHIGHLRVAIETWQALGKLITRVELLPVNMQPLKDPLGILPFEWRCQMIEDSIKPLLNFSCNQIEGKRCGPSYTYDTLIAYPQTETPQQRFFVLGSEDFSQLKKWKNGTRLPEISNLVVIPRYGDDLDMFSRTVKSLWPEFEGKPERMQKKPLSEVWQVTLHNGGKIYYVKIPFLNISSTYIRKSWLKNENIAWLVPEPVLRFLNYNHQQIQFIWEAKN